MDCTLLRQWIRRLFTAARRPRPSASRSRPAFRPTLESLEIRLTPSVTFAGQQTVGAGNGPYAVAVADFNGDGRPDLVTANFTDGTVSVLLNTTNAGATTPSFAFQETFAVGTNPYSVAVGDFNGDGRPDIVVANRNAAGTVSILLNTTAPGATAPSFAAAQTFAVGNTPYSVVFGDFNGDGRPDIAVANFGSGTVSVLMDTSPAGAVALSFAAQQTFTVGANPISVAVGDFNGDGKPDIAVANRGGDTVSVLADTTGAGATTASFAAQQTFAVGSLPYSVAVGDFNDDGRPDLVVANEAAGSVSVLMDTTVIGSATLSFAAQQTFAVGANPFSVAVGDFDGDGRPDIVTANNATNGTLSVLLDTTAAGATTASFAAQQTLAAGNLPASVAVGDFNADGRTDVVAANSGDKTASVLLDTTTPFAVTTPVIVADFPGAGVWELNRVKNAWVQINVTDAALLASDPAGDVVADFHGYGLWEYRAVTGGWTLLNGTDATALAMDPHGNIAVTFPGYGVAEYLPSSGWRMLTPVAASLLAMDANGDVFGEFSGYGVYQYRPVGGWKLLNGTDATALAVNASGALAVNFAGYGVAEYLQATGWQMLISNQASSLAIDANGDVTASLAGLGIDEYRPAFGWRGQSAAAASALAMDANGDVFAEISGYGIWEFDPYPGWYRLSVTDVSLLAVA